MLILCIPFRFFFVLFMTLYDSASLQKQNKNLQVMYILSSGDITYFVYHFETFKGSYHACLQSFI